METKKFNSTQPTDKSKKNKKNIGSHAATAAGAAVAGGIFGAMANEHVNPAEDPVEDIVDPQPVQPIPSEPEKPADVINEELQTEEEPVIVQAEPITETMTETPTTTEDSITNEELEQESITEEFVDPDLIAEAIIAGDEIDPDDIDMADVINFTDIGTVYTVDGQSYTAATFHDETGSELLMVDVDGDNIFDVVATQEGHILAETGGILSVSDVESELFNDDGIYLAQSEVENMSSTPGESFMGDIINT